MSAVQARDDGAHPVLGEPGGAHLPRDALHLAGAGADGVHLDHGGHEGEIDALVAFDHLLREEAAGAQLGDARRQCAGAGGKRPLEVAVAAVGTASAQLVGPGVHHGVLELLGKPAEQIPHVDDVVVEPGRGELSV